MYSLLDNHHNVLFGFCVGLSLFFGQNHNSHSLIALMPNHLNCLNVCGSFRRQIVHSPNTHFSFNNSHNMCWLLFNSHKNFNKNNLVKLINDLQRICLKLTESHPMFYKNREINRCRLFPDADQSFLQANITSTA